MLLFTSLFIVALHFPQAVAIASTAFTFGHLPAFYILKGISKNRHLSRAYGGPNDILNVGALGISFSLLLF